MPSKTPPARVTQLNRDIVKVVETPAARSQLGGYGVTVAGTPLAAFADEIKNELRLWAEVANRAGIKPQ